MWGMTKSRLLGQAGKSDRERCYRLEIEFPLDKIFFSPEPSADYRISNCLVEEVSFKAS